MDPIMLVVVFGAVFFAGRASLKHASAALVKSRDEKIAAAQKESLTPLPSQRLQMLKRQHDVGWWASEVLHGAPVIRTGWHAGWLAHKAAADHARQRREIARTTQIETSASFAEAMNGHRQRREEARRQIATVIADTPAGGKEAVREAADAVVLPFPRRSQPEVPDAVKVPEPGPYAAPAGDLAERLNAAQRARDLNGQRNLCAACGRPGTPADPLVIADDGYRVHQSDTTDPSSGYFAERTVRYDELRPGDQTNNPAGACSCPHPERPWLVTAIRKDGDGNAQPVLMHLPCGEGWSEDYIAPECLVPLLGRQSASNSPSTATEGAPVTVQAETTYDQSIHAANQLIAEADTEITRLRMRQIGAMVENLASVAVDSGNLSHLTDVDDAVQAQIAAAQRQLDSAQAFRTGLIRDHGAGAEYHHSAPNGGAERSFLRE